jgi:uncharacterized protein YbjT (DUF2867 family)
MNMSNPKILVTSAAGHTGIPTTLQLLEQGYPVRAFVRSDDARAQRLREAGAEIFVGDIYSIADMRQAMDGVQRAYHCMPMAPNGLHFGTVFSVVAQEVGLEHVVMLSQWTSSSDHPSMTTREVWLNEQVLKLLPDTTLTVVNVGWFAENYFMGILEPIVQLGVLPMPLGDGDVKKNAPPSSNDIAAVIVAALIDPAAHAGKTYRPTGPELLSPNEIASIMGNVLGRKVRYLDISGAMTLKALKLQGYGEAMPIQLVKYTKDYRRGAFAVHAPNNVVRVLTGREAESFESFTRHIVANRPETVRSLGNKLKAIRNFMKIPLAKKIDADAAERRRNHVLLKTSSFVQDSAAWRETHDPKAGFVPDRPANPSWLQSGKNK